MSALRKIIFIATLMGLLSLAAFGQMVSGDLVGTVTDNTGAFVPNASVKATNLATGFTANTKTNGSGEYHFVNLPVGHYSLRASPGTV